MKHIFISYTRKNSGFAEKLHKILEQEGFSVWRDTDRIYVGDNWRDKIDQAIKGCFALIVLMTPAAIKSQYVTYEWSFALGLGVKVIPLSLIKEPKLHPRLVTHHYLDFSNRDKPYEDLFKKLRKTESIEKLKLENSIYAAMSGGERQRMDHEIAGAMRKAKEHIDIHDAYFSKGNIHPWQEEMTDILKREEISVNLIMADPKSLIYKKRRRLLGFDPKAGWPNQLKKLVQNYAKTPNKFKLLSTKEIFSGPFVYVDRKVLFLGCFAPRIHSDKAPIVVLRKTRRTKSFFDGLEKWIDSRPKARL